MTNPEEGWIRKNYTEFASINIEKLDNCELIPNVGYVLTNINDSILIPNTTGHKRIRIIGSPKYMKNSASGSIYLYGGEIYQQINFSEYVEFGQLSETETNALLIESSLPIYDASFNMYQSVRFQNSSIDNPILITAIEFSDNQGGELMEREIMLGLGRIKVKKAEDTEYTEIGDTKSEAKLAIEEKYADVKTVESGTIKKVLESTTVTLEATISQLSKELLAKLTNMTNTAGVLSGGGGIGTVAPEFELIFHPLDESGTDWDVKFFRCTLETKLEKNAKPGEQAGLNIKAEALYDREAGKKFQIG